jgi:hypothetical protein
MFKKIFIVLMLSVLTSTCAFADAEANYILNLINAQLQGISNNTVTNDSLQDLLIAKFDSMRTTFTIKLDSMILCNLEMIDSINAMSADLQNVLIELEPSDTSYIEEYDTLALDSTITITPGFTTKYWGYSFVKYGVNDGPVRFIVTYSSGLVDTLFAPHSLVNMGAQGSFLPAAEFFPMEITQLNIKCIGALDYLKIFIFGKHTAP